MIPPATAGNFNVYGGIYRDVRLVFTDRLHVREGRRHGGGRAFHRHRDDDQAEVRGGFEWPVVVEIIKRSTDSGLSAIRDVAFSDLTIYTKGRIRACGLPDRAIEGVSFRNLNVRSTGYEELDSAKPARDGPPDYPNTPAAFILTHIKGLSLGGLRITWPADGFTTGAMGGTMMALFSQKERQPW